MRNTLFIINPASARGATLRAWSDARKRIAALGIDFDEHVTTRAGEATEATREALRAGAIRIIAVGGDGTLNEVVNGYFNDRDCAINEAASIGLLPSGTGSDFRRSLELTSCSASIRTLIDSETRLLDAARAEFKDQDGASVSRLFINVASFGLGGDVSALVNQWRGSLPRWIGGRARFATAVVAALGHYKNVAVSLRIDEREMKISSNLIVVANGRFGGGGMMLAPHAELDDGLLDVIVTDEATRLDVIKELPRIQRGGHLKNHKVSELRAREVSIFAEEPMAIDLDGEMVGYTPALLRVLPSAIRFLG
ncbi:MAG: diacylglycerol kinase family protein [Acidobacteriota bacterium]